MTYGLQIYNAAGVLTFDSQQAVGGVCLGYHTVPNGGGTLSFPAITQASGVYALGGQGYSVDSYSGSMALGYLQVTFPDLGFAHEVLLFVI